MRFLVTIVSVGYDHVTSRIFAIFLAVLLSGAGLLL